MINNRITAPEIEPIIIPIISPELKADCDDLLK